LGICAKDGVVIATDKKLTSELVDVAHVHKVELLTPSCGVCYAGVGPDFRVLGECWMAWIYHFKMIVTALCFA
jgi:20S proteasome subunit alpha 2